MVKDKLEELSRISGFVGASIVDGDTGICLGFFGGRGLDLEQAGSMLSNMLFAHRDALAGAQAEELIVNLGQQVHVMRPLEDGTSLLVYLVLDRKYFNLVRARRAIDAVGMPMAA